MLGNKFKRIFFSFLRSYELRHQCGRQIQRHREFESEKLCAIFLFIRFFRMMTLTLTYLGGTFGLKSKHRIKVSLDVIAGWNRFFFGDSFRPISCRKVSEKKHFFCCDSQREWNFIKFSFSCRQAFELSKKKFPTFSDFRVLFVWRRFVVENVEI